MRRTSLFISEAQLAGLKALKVAHGVPEAESIRRALAAYLTEKGVLKPEARPTRAPALRKRA